MRRFLYISRRFGLTPHKQIEFIKYYIFLLKKNNVKGTFFIPATMLSSYSGQINRIEAENIEWGIHSDIHTDLTMLEKESQRKHIDNAISIFDKHKIPFKGFRAPYMRIDNSLLEAVCRQKRFLYDSSNSVICDEVYQDTHLSYDWARSFYSPQLHSQKRAFPAIIKQLVQIPVTLPDDDMLVDRDRLDPDSILKIWRRILKRYYENKEVFVLQLHPERIFYLGTALDSLIREAKSFEPPIWIATLGEVAEWRRESGLEERWPAPYKSALCITGDIDMLTITDFLDRLRKW
ncbi:MAG: polysaccharide deacetylase family protein [Candidatus Omnitrophota bacterium]